MLKKTRFLPHSRKFEFLISQGSTATQLS